MKTSPSKSSSSSRTSPYHGRVPEQAATGAGGIANGNVENEGVIVIVLKLPNSGTAGNSQGQPGQVIVTNERKIELNGGDLLITRLPTGQTVYLFGDEQQEHQATVVKRVIIDGRVGPVQCQQQQEPVGQIVQQQQGPVGQVVQQQQGPVSQVVQMQQGPVGQVVQQQQGPVSQVVQMQQGPVGQVVQQQQGPVSQVVQMQQGPVGQVVQQQQGPVGRAVQQQEETPPLSPSKSTRSSRTSPYHGRLPGQAATCAGGVANGNVENAAVNGIQLPESGTVESSPGQQDQAIVRGMDEVRVPINGRTMQVTRLPNGQIAIFVEDQEEHQASIGEQGPQAFNDGAVLCIQGLQGHVCRDPKLSFIAVKRGLIQDGVGVIRGDQLQGPVELIVQVQGEEMPPPPVQGGQGSSSYCVIRNEVDSLQGSVDQLSEKLDIQGGKITNMRDGVRNAAVALREVGQEQEGLGEGHGANGDGEDEEVDDDYDKLILAKILMETGPVWGC